MTLKHNETVDYIESTFEGDPLIASKKRRRKPVVLRPLLTGFLGSKSRTTKLKKIEIHVLPRFANLENLA